jgi:hypothetical protein
MVLARTARQSATLLLGLVLTLVLALLARCSSEEEKAIAGQFVGAAGNDTFVAVVADEPVTMDSERKVQVFVCDGKPQGIAEWFTGSLAGNTFDLTSVRSNAQIHGTLAQTSGTGTVALPDGRSLDFDVSRTRGREGGGIYELTSTPEGQLSGSSNNGAQLVGRIESNGTVIGTIILPDFQTIDYVWRVVSESGGGVVQPDSYTVIVRNGAQEARGRSGDVQGGNPGGIALSALR